LAWVLFIISFVFLGFKSLFLASSDKLIRFLVISSFFGSLFLWIANIVYVPSNVVFYLTFIFTGLFLAILFISGALKMKYGLYVNSSKKNFITVLMLIVLIIVTLSAEYYIVKYYLANKYFRQAFISANVKGNIDEAEAKLLKAVSFVKNDIYYRSLSDIGIIRMGNLISTTDKNISEDALRTSFQNILGSTLSYADSAIKVDNTNYLNWINKGKIFEAIVPLKVQGSYEQSKANYEESIKYNPNNPAIYLIMARLEFTKGDNAKAKEHISTALSKKRNYTDAIFLLSQIETKEGNIKGAINSVQSAATLSPNDPTIFFQLGLLYFNNKEYKNAVGALEQAIKLNPIYANARYFLGLSYEKVGNDQLAIAQFEELQKTNSDNQEVTLILNNLKAGRSPFSNAKSPIDDKPEKRVNPPIKGE
jgi:tetratricopeptide (TPR) repeat protein